MFIPIATVLVVILLSMMVTRIATIALTLTGMTREIARFQARSALTGSGFTTIESEAIAAHPVRRRIISTLMLIGSAGIVSVIAGVTLTFAQSTSNRDAGVRLLFLLVGVFGLFWTLRLGPVDRALSRLIRRLLLRYTDLNIRSFASMMEIHGDYTIAEMHVDEDAWVAGRTLEDLRLNDEGLLVLGVQHADGVYEGAPTGATGVRPGDLLVIYGHQDRIAALDKRPKGPAGDADSYTTRQFMVPEHLRRRGQTHGSATKSADGAAGASVDRAPRDRAPREWVVADSHAGADGPGPGETPDHVGTDTPGHAGSGTHDLDPDLQPESERD